jgi:hypothetical protein
MGPFAYFILLYEDFDMERFGDGCFNRCQISYVFLIYHVTCSFTFTNKEMRLSKKKINK